MTSFVDYWVFLKTPKQMRLSRVAWDACSVSAHRDDHANRFDTTSSHSFVIQVQMITHRASLRCSCTSRTRDRNIVRAMLERLTDPQLVSAPSWSLIIFVQSVTGYAFHNSSLLQEALDTVGFRSPHANRRLAIIGETRQKDVVLDDWFPTGATRGT